MAVFQTTAVWLPRNHFFSSMFSKIVTAKHFWSMVKSISSSHNCVPATIYRGTASATSPIEKASLLNDHFTSTFSQKSLPPTAPLSPRDVSVLNSVSCSSTDILSLIKKQRWNVALGHDGISSTIIKECGSSICSSLSSLFNSSLTQGKVPLDWKISNIAPIPKSGDPTKASNYRPISLLCLCSKLLERLVHNALTEHITENNLLSSNQFGFWKHSSTMVAILSATRDWHVTLEERGSVACVFLDLAKAFDSLPHQLVLESLARVGVQGSLYAWFEDYLSNRFQCVVLEGSRSAPAPVTSGVPQGSILGPLLFVLSMDTLSNVIYCFHIHVC